MKKLLIIFIFAFLLASCGNDRKKEETNHIEEKTKIIIEEKLNSGSIVNEDKEVEVKKSINREEIIIENKIDNITFLEEDNFKLKDNNKKLQNENEKLNKGVLESYEYSNKLEKIFNNTVDLYGNKSLSELFTKVKSESLKSYNGNDYYTSQITKVIDFIRVFKSFDIYIDNINFLNLNTLGSCFGLPCSTSADLIYDGIDIYLYENVLLMSKNTFKNIKYKCDGGLFGGKDYYYCKTNNNSYLEQYEILEDSGHGTGAGKGISWYKYYLVNVYGKNIMFRYDIDKNSEYEFDTLSDITEFSKKEFLDRIISKNKDYIFKMDNRINIIIGNYINK